MIIRNLSATMFVNTHYSRSEHLFRPSCWVDTSASRIDGRPSLLQHLNSFHFGSGRRRVKTSSTDLLPRLWTSVAEIKHHICYRLYAICYLLAISYTSVQRYGAVE